MTLVPPGEGRLWVIGCGNMGRALLDAALGAGLSPDRVSVVDPAMPGDLDPAIRTAPSPALLGEIPTAVLFAVKPQLLQAASGELAPHVPAGAIILSILAGTSTEVLRQRFPRALVVRAMPNTPARIGRGVTALFADHESAAARQFAQDFFAASGEVVWLDDERLFDAVTAVSGSGPAYLFHFIEALACAGESVGLPQDLSRALARRTVTGAAALAEHSDEEPEELRRQVTSPRGTTEAGLAQLMPELTGLVSRTVAAAARRSAELAAETAPEEPAAD
jgi:pyrroline-5-carboxylate reductase